MISRRAILAALLLVLVAVPAAAAPEAWTNEGWTRTDFERTSVPWSEILSGGPPRDGIPSIDQPVFKTVLEAVSLTPNDPVIGLEIAGDARAYPLRILIWHEIVNDTVGGMPVTVTYCPLCNTALVFDRTVNGKVLDFGTTGKLRNSDLVMYDRQTESWWQQFLGQAIVGDMLGTALTPVPARLESYVDFRERHPDGKVLVPRDPAFRDYGRNPYAGYDSTTSPFLYNGDMPEGIEPMARVVVARPKNAKPVLVSLVSLREAGKLRIGTLAFSWKAGQASAVDAAEIAKGRDVGTVEVHDMGESTEPIPVAYDVSFAFTAHAFYPDIPIQQ